VADWARVGWALALFAEQALVTAIPHMARTVAKPRWEYRRGSCIFGRSGLPNLPNVFPFLTNVTLAGTFGKTQRRWAVGFVGVGGPETDHFATIRFQRAAK
jgi:hypothetical protein